MPALSPMARKRRPMTTPSVAVGLLLCPAVVLSPAGRWTLGRSWKRYVAALDDVGGNNGRAVYCDIAATGDGGRVSGASDGDIAALDADGDAAGGESHVAAAAHCGVSDSASGRGRKGGFGGG